MTAPTAEEIREMAALWSRPMTEPTESEVRQMAEWAGLAYEYDYGDHFDRLAWNDGRLLFAMLERLGVEDGTTHSLQRVSKLWANSDWTLAEAVVYAWREVTK